MKLFIERQDLLELTAAFPHLAPLAEQLKLGHKAEVAYRQLSAEEWAFLERRYRAGGKQQQTALLESMAAALHPGARRYQADDLEALLPDLANYFIDDAIRGWLFQIDHKGRNHAFLITRLDYTPPGEEETGRIIIELKANSKGKILVEQLLIRCKDLSHVSIAEILSARGFLKETPAMIEAYDAVAARYFDWRGRYGEQFSGWGVGVYAEDPSANQRNTDWSRKPTVILSSTGDACRLVNDENILSDRALSLEATGDILAKYLRKAGKSLRYDSKTETALEAVHAGLRKELFTELPLHPYILMFHLDLHHHVWVHTEDLKPYAYKPALKQKLILPPEQTDLIDILTAEMDVLMDDIVAGKSGGATVLCAGPAGVGKTLTAEVYSEIIQRPLYRVHSGQLGLNVGEMEKILKETLIRAQRWGAVMLIDEADVYIKRRNDNLAANAVVGVFLRVLEYFNGLLFLTTNRVDDIDEAIISRCIALIKFSTPNSDDRRKIWRVMTEQFQLPLADALIEELTEIFPQATGRDIKGLCKLAAKFSRQKQIPPDITVFKHCALFRGLDAHTQTHG